LQIQSLVPSSRKGYISSLRGYQRYCTTRKIREFPLVFIEVKRFLGLANTAESANAWLAAIKKASVL
ncbi:unnamed protein product, partial [Amoebophrya sp. A25]